MDIDNGTLLMNDISYSGGGGTLVVNGVSYSGVTLKPNVAYLGSIAANGTMTISEGDEFIVVVSSGSSTANAVTTYATATFTNATGSDQAFTRANVGSVYYGTRVYKVTRSGDGNITIKANANAPITFVFKVL